MKFEEVKETLGSTFQGPQLDSLFESIVKGLGCYDYAEGILTLIYEDGEQYQMHGDHPESEDVFYIIEDRRNK